MEVHEEACHWMQTFPTLEAFTRGIRYPKSLDTETFHWQMNYPNLITTEVPCKVPDWTTNNYPASGNTEQSGDRSEDE